MQNALEVSTEGMTFCRELRASNHTSTFHHHIEGETELGSGFGSYRLKRGSEPRCELFSLGQTRGSRFGKLLYEARRPSCRA